MQTCTRCYSPMLLTRQENYAGSRQQWYGCPCCKRIEFITMPATPLIQLATHMREEHHGLTAITR